jgi:hypothetical protein
MDDIDFAYKIRNKNDCQKDISLMSQVARLKPSGVCKFKNRFFVNGVGFDGTMIDAGRLDRYSCALSAQGLKMDPSKWRKFFEAADGLHFVTVWKYPDGVVNVACECVRDFFEKTACPHAYVVKYLFAVPANCNRESNAYDKPKVREERRG